MPEYKTVCEVCFDDYNEDTKRPMTLYCCKKIVCFECLESLGKSTSSCPWDRRRWTARNLILKCEEVTPSDLLSTLQQCGVDAFDDDQGHLHRIQMNRMNGESEGLIRREYEESLKAEEERIRLKRVQERRDEALARALSQRGESPISTNPNPNPKTHPSSSFTATATVTSTRLPTTTSSSSSSASSSSSSASSSSSSLGSVRLLPDTASFSSSSSSSSISSSSSFVDYVALFGGGDKQKGNKDKDKDKEDKRSGGWRGVNANENENENDRSLYVVNGTTTPTTTATGMGTGMGTSMGTGWHCDVCTFLNSISVRRCAMCETLTKNSRESSNSNSNSAIQSSWGGGGPGPGQKRERADQSLTMLNFITRPSKKTSK